MPFEMGVAYALAQRRSHRIFPFEAKEHRLDASLSDMKAFDAIVHGGTHEGILQSILKCFDKPGGAPPLRTLKSMNARLSLAAHLALRDFPNDPYNLWTFRRLVAAATKEAKRRGLIAA
jgi:hypothetical protein